MNRLRLLPLLLLAACLDSPSPDRAPVIIGSKSDPVGVVLSEIAAQRLEARGCTVERRFRLGDPKQLDAALDSGRIDAYAEEFSTAFTKILGRDIAGEEGAAETEVRGLYIKRDLVWAPLIGFRDSAIVYRKPIDEKCRRASRAMMSLGFATSGTDIAGLAARVGRGEDVTKVVRESGVAR